MSLLWLTHFDLLLYDPFISRRSEEDEVPDVTNLIPKLTLLISDSDVIDISMDKHGKSDNFIISVDNCNQLLLSADSEELKARVSNCVIAYKLCIRLP